MDKMHVQWTNGETDLNSPTISVTPYGGRLVWILPGKTKITVHLKDKTKIRNRKRWSQVLSSLLWMEIWTSGRKLLIF